MSPDPVETADELLARSLSAYQDALSAGQPPFTPDMPGELLPRFERARASLDLLERVYPRQYTTAAALLERMADNVWPKQIGRFPICGLLGQGGFGVVFLAEDVRLNRQVALKIPHATTLVDRRARHRFLSEAEIMAEVEHPNIVPVYEAGEAGAWLYIASEYCRGRTLAAWIEEHRVSGSLPPPREAAQLLLTLARAVEHLHRLLVLHRDLKPSNVLLTGATDLGEAVPKITDFGLAKSLPRGGNDTRTDFALGTPGYAAPEQAGGRLGEIGAHTDVYALGAILYELVTGRRACTGEGDEVHWDDVLHREPTAPSRLAKVPRDLETICLKCLRKVTHERYPSARELADDLSRFLEGRPIHARPVWPGERLLKWGRRHPVQASLLGLGVVTILAVVTMGWQMRRLGAEARERERDLQAVRKTAEVNRYHSLVFRGQEVMNSRPLGWVDKALQDLDEASRIPTEARDAILLRSLAARCLAGVDLRKNAVLAEGVDAFCLAFSPDSRYLAVGDRSGGRSCAVLVYEVATKKLVHKLACRSASPGRTGVRAMAYHPTRPWLLVGTRHGEIHRWELSGSSPTCQTFRAHEDRVAQLRFLPGTDLLVSASADTSVKVWDVMDKPLVRQTVTLPGPAHELAIQPFPFRLFLGDSRLGIRSYAVDRLQPAVALREVEAGRFRECEYVCVSPNAPLRVFVRRGVSVLAVQSTDTKLVEPRLDIPHPNQPAFREELNHMEFHPSSGLVVTGSGDRIVRLWALATGRLAVEAGVPGVGNVYPVFSPDGRWVAFPEDKRTLLFGVCGLGVQQTVAHHTRPVRAFAFAPDGKSLACFAQDDNVETYDKAQVELTTWDLATAKRRTHYEIDPPPPVGWSARASLAYHPGGGGLALTAAVFRAVQSFDLDRREHRSLPKLPMTWSLAFPPSGGRLWGVLDSRHDSLLRKATPNTDQVVSASWPDLKEATRWAHTGSSIRKVTRVAAGDRWVLAGTHSGRTKLLRTGDGQLEKDWESPGGASVRSVALSPGESLAASGTQAGALQVARLPDAACVAVIAAHTDSLDALAFSPSGQVLATGGRDRKVHLWRRAGESFEKLITLHFDAGVTSLAFHPHGNILGVLCHDEYAVRLWHLDRLQERLETMGLGW